MGWFVVRMEIVAFASISVGVPTKTKGASLSAMKSSTFTTTEISKVGSVRIR